MKLTQLAQVVWGRTSTTAVTGFQRLPARVVEVEETRGLASTSAFPRVPETERGIAFLP